MLLCITMILPGKKMDQRPAQRISVTGAINIAVQHVGAKVYAWQDAGAEQRLKMQAGIAFCCAISNAT
jgi:hypothetical protein